MTISIPEAVMLAVGPQLNDRDWSGISYSFQAVSTGGALATIS
jgi:hypothetical protein